METNLLPNSENLYKYLVSIGLILMISTVYYPLRERQELELLTIQLEFELRSLSYEINENQKNLLSLLDNNNNQLTLTEIDNLNKRNNLKQIELERKVEERKLRKFYIKAYSYLFFVFFPLGILLTIYGFYKWKIIEDKSHKKAP